MGCWDCCGVCDLVRDLVRGRHVAGWSDAEPPQAASALLMKADIERLAQAVAEFGPEGNQAADFEREIVRVVLQAMREPSEGMVSASEGFVERAGCETAVWQAMIDELLDESR